MKEIVAFLLARLGGNDEPSKKDVVKILDSVGIRANDAKMDALFVDIDQLRVPLEGRAIDNAIAERTAKLNGIEVFSAIFLNDIGYSIQKVIDKLLIEIQVCRSTLFPFL